MNDIFVEIALSQPIVCEVTISDLQSSESGGYVRFDIVQGLSPADQARGRENIGASSAADSETIVLSLTTLSASADIPIPAGAYIKDVNVLLVSGNPTIDIEAIGQTGLTGQDIYRCAADKKFPEAGVLHVDITGTGSVKVQITKYNV